MYYWQPGKWLQFAVSAAVPWGAAALFNTNSLVTDISTRAAAVAGDWAKVSLNARDATITGSAPSQEAADAAINAIATTYGIRTVDISGIKIAPPAPKTAEATPAEPKAAEPKVAEAPKAAEATPAAPESLAAPVISEAKIVDNLPVVSGTWPEGKAKTLEVTIDNHTYKLGTDPELSSSGGNWVLKPTAPLAAGNYSVTAKDGDGATSMAAAEKPADLKVEAPPVPEALAAPTIEGSQASGDQATITGSWPESKAKSLDVTVNSKLYKLGEAPELTSKDGTWTLKLEGLAAGPYTISASDGDGSQTATAVKPLSLEVAAPPPPPPAMPLAAATVNPINIEPDKPVTITGTWLVGIATGLSVGVNDTVSVLGKDFNLLTDTAGKWKLTEPADLAPGKYTVVVTETGADGKTVQSSGSFEIAAPPPPPPPPPKAAPPAAPTIESTKSDSDHPTIKGTWPVAAGNGLQVELDGVTHTLGKDFDLLSDTSGKWTLTPIKPVVNGTYDVVAKVTAADGQSSLDASKDELTVAVAPPPPPPAPEQPYDCEGTLAKIAAVFPIRFEFDHADLGAKYQQALSQYTALLSDKRCAALKVQVAGHADYLGPAAYNMGLSENRAKTVVDALTAAKVDAGRLSSIGLGSSKPLDPAHSNDARAKNRRVEFSIQK